MLYAVGQITYKVRKINRAQVQTIQKFILDLLVLVQTKTKADRERDKLAKINK